jgi:hypothetical protein
LQRPEQPKLVVQHFARGNDPNAWLDFSWRSIDAGRDVLRTLEERDAVSSPGDQSRNLMAQAWGLRPHCVGEENVVLHHG